MSSLSMVFVHGYFRGLLHDIKKVPSGEGQNSPLVKQGLQTVLVHGSKQPTLSSGFFLKAYSFLWGTFLK